MRKIFDEQAAWYKGNLHTHTTRSDGRMSLEDCLRLYASHGYHFIAVTDHNNPLEGEHREGLLVLDGAEYDINDLGTRRAYHITAIGTPDRIEKEGLTPQQIIDEIIGRNALAIVAHPSWSLLTHDDLMALRSFAGIEIWNTVSHSHSGRGDSVGYLDVLASKGRPTLAFAVDDTHFYNHDLFGGYIMVNCGQLDSEAILAAIRGGRFYCSQGPEIRQIDMEEGAIRVRTSPVASILFMSDSFYCHNRVCRGEGGPITEATYDINPTDRFVRVECVDERGKKAWSQFIAVEN